MKINSRANVNTYNFKKNKIYKKCIIPIILIVLIKPFSANILVVSLATSIELFKMNFKMYFLIFLLIFLSLGYTKAENGDDTPRTPSPNTRTTTTTKRPSKKNIKIVNIKFEKAKRKIKSPLVKSLKQLIKQNNKPKVVRRVVRPKIVVIG